MTINTMFGSFDLYPTYDINDGGAKMSSPQASSEAELNVCSRCGSNFQKNGQGRYFCSVCGLWKEDVEVESPPVEKSEPQETEYDPY